MVHWTSRQSGSLCQTAVKPVRTCYEQCHRCTRLPRNPRILRACGCNRFTSSSVQLSSGSTAQETLMRLPSSCALLRSCRTSWTPRHLAAMRTSRHCARWLISTKTGRTATSGLSAGPTLSLSATWTLAALATRRWRHFRQSAKCMFSWLVTHINDLLRLKGTPKAHVAASTPPSCWLGMFFARPTRQHESVSAAVGSARQSSMQRPRDV